MDWDVLVLGNSVSAWLSALGVFLAIMAAFFTRGMRAQRAAFEAGEQRRGAALLGLQAAVAAALAVGLLDHYFFNIEFSHMVALLWGTVGLALVVEATGGRWKTEAEDQRPKTKDQSTEIAFGPWSSVLGPSSKRNW